MLKKQDQGHSESEEDAGRHIEKEYVMSLDISEYELQMLEKLEEECILAFQTQQASAPKNSNDMEGDEDFDDEMKVPILALMATASPSIREDIIKSLHLINPLIPSTSFDQPNLYLGCQSQVWGGFEFEGSAIVYCPSKKEAERVSVALCKLDIPCGVYHLCGWPTWCLGWVLINLISGRSSISGPPKEMDSYYHEIGRAGRDTSYSFSTNPKFMKDDLFWCGFSVNRKDPEVALQDFGSCAYQLMKAVSAMDERFGITVPVLFLRGLVRQTENHLTPSNIQN
ncbi:hypothetical protein cypCar_00041428 [Cyprinus carpio]|nr:hypothetical protein cypCar_00041428 [Cyprinus carpio]